MSLRRAEWSIWWTQQVANKRTFHMSNHEEGLGRVMYVAGALEQQRSFLSFLHSASLCIVLPQVSHDDDSAAMLRLRVPGQDSEDGFCT